jgi:hypothetical protein
MAGKLFPQPDQDADAANFAQWNSTGIAEAYAVRGVELTNPDYSAGTVDVTAGKVRIWKESFEATQKSKVREHGTQFMATLDAQTLSLDDTSVNFIYVVPGFQQAGTKTPSFSVTQAQNPPTPESVLIGEVDCPNSTTSERNRFPDGEFGDLTTENLDSTVKNLMPSYSGTGNAPAEPGNVIYVDGTGSEEAGVYSYNDDQSVWDGPLEGGAKNTNTQTAVSENGTELVANTADIDFTKNIVATDDGDGTVSVNVEGNALGYNTTSVSSAYTASDMEAVFCDASGGAFTVTLPPVGADTQIVLHKTDSSGNSVTVDPNGSETINGDTTDELSAQYESIELISDGNEWFII